MADDAPLLAILEPPAPEDGGPQPGELRGVPEGLAAGIEVWCGPAMGWRRFGDLVTQRATVIRQHGRAIGALTFDLGAVKQEAELEP